MTSEDAGKQLRRSHDAYVGGVCAGIAEYLDFDPIVIRILAILLTGLTLGLAVIVYAILWARIPRRAKPALPYDVMPESAESSTRGSVDCAFNLEEDSSRSGRLPILARVAVAAGLMVLFLVVAVNLSPLMPGTQWWQFWPLGFLIVGLCLIIIPVRTRFEAAWHALGVVVTSVSASLLPMSLGVVSWNTIPYAFEMLWPLAAVILVLFALGMYRNVNALVLASAFCVVAFCVLASTFCVLPGEMETLLLHMPSGHSFQFFIPR